MTNAHPVFARLARERQQGLVVVAHRGDSSHHPENTVPAFAAALSIGVAMQEFDVRATRDGVLVCIHDATFDRTTDAASRLGPGALVAGTTWAEVQQLDAGSWFDADHRGTRIPTLDEVLRLLAPTCIAMVEHKAGDPDAYVRALRQAGSETAAVLQSFDWSFVTEARRLAPHLALALLGPTARVPRLDATAVDAALGVGAGMLHWDAGAVGPEQVALCHGAGLQLCTYTSDDALAISGGAAIGVDAMCTNRPARMIALAKRLDRPQSPQPSTSDQ